MNKYVYITSANAPEDNSEPERKPGDVDLAAGKNSASEKPRQFQTYKLIKCVCFFLTRAGRLVARGPSHTPKGLPRRIFKKRTSIKILACFIGGSSRSLHVWEECPFSEFCSWSAINTD